jgi:thioredoxin-dependent peroxiredoxin
MLKENEVAPDFTLPDQNGRPVSLSDFRGHKVVLYFYPKDDTSGCTVQACELRDHAEEFDARDAVVLGVSPDSPTSHTSFREKYHLPFTLLADVDHTLATTYGVWVEKMNYGRTYWGNERTTFVIGEDGRIVKILPRVKPAEHATRVLQLI